MAHIAPFKALRPNPELAPAVASRPYDVLNSEEARLEVKNNPDSFLHITKSEIDLPGDVHQYSSLVYEKAKENLGNMIQHGVLLKEEKPCYYIYKLVMGKRSQTGLVCVSSVDDYNNNLIKKHEFTRPEKENDRINHMKCTGAQTGNVFLAYKNDQGLDELIENWKHSHQPVYDFVADDKVAHTIWIVDDENTINNITEIFESRIPATYIADGHHRAASAAKVREALGAKATPEASWFLTTLFPSNQLEIMDYNRVVKDLNGYTPEEFLSALQDDFNVTQSTEPVSPSTLHEFGFYLNHHWYILSAKSGTWTNDPIGVLDVTILSDNILDKLLDIKDQRTDKRIDFVGGIRGLKALEERVNSGEMAAAFSLYPVSIQQLFDIADSGNVMPPKSTWFEPKLRDGLLTHLIN
ncbi:MAG TPA: DUF1015 family protein [Chitinophagaceae bacterium]|nr:DUF1015 family protein [Chitinophagaceae bacterium]